MNQRRAHRLGVDSGLEAAEYGDFTPAELQDEGAFLEACFEICENKRQYAGHPGYDFSGQKNSAELWDAFDKGETVGMRKGWRKRCQDLREWNHPVAERCASHPAQTACDSEFVLEERPQSHRVHQHVGRGQGTPTRPGQHQFVRGVGQKIRHGTLRVRGLWRMLASSLDSGSGNFSRIGRALPF